jgi:hypothetical protein
MDGYLTQFLKYNCTLPRYALRMRDKIFFHN